MREIIFRGQQVKGLFIKGHYYVNDEGKHLLCFTEKRHRMYGETIEYGECQVAPETIGQYTGLKDKNGVMIFEGDIVKSESGRAGDIQFSHGIFGIEWADCKENNNMVGSWGQVHNLRHIDDNFNKNIEIIGNIYDDPELLQEGIEMSDSDDRVRIFNEIENERIRQYEKWGEQNYPIKPPHYLINWKYQEEQAKALCDRCQKEGCQTWYTILWEEFCEVFSEDEPQKQREELVQLAAVAVQIIEYLDRKECKD